MKYNIAPLEEIHANAITQLWRDALSAAIKLPPLHSFQSQQHFLTEIQTLTHSVTVAVSESDNEPLGFMASNANEVAQLYIKMEYQGQGIGSDFIARAKQQSAGSLTLRTFEINQPAQAFYEKHGFVKIGGDDSNEEGLPDILYQWTR